MPYGTYACEGCGGDYFTGPAWEDECYCEDCYLERFPDPRFWHSHAENVGHSHDRGDEEHRHIGRRADDGSIVWMTLWPHEGWEETTR